MFGGLSALDVHLFELVNGVNGGAFGDAFFRAMTLLGDWRVFIPGSVFVSAALFRKFGWTATLYFTIALCATGALTHVAKRSIDRARPTVAADLCPDRPAVAGHEHSTTLRTTRYCAHSFPSGHTSAAFTWLLGIALILGASWRGTAVALGLAMGVALSRIYLGVHYPLDVLAGAALGAASAVVTARQMRLRQRFEPKESG